MTIRITGDRGSATVLDVIHPQDDDRPILDVDGSERIVHTGSRTAYTYQLGAFRATIREGRPFSTNTEDSLSTTEWIDACSGSVGLNLRNAAS